MASPIDDPEHLRRAVASGALPMTALHVAALCGHEPAATALDGEAPTPPRDLEDLLTRVSLVDPAVFREAVVRVVAEIALLRLEALGVDVAPMSGTLRLSGQLADGDLARLTATAVRSARQRHSVVLAGDRRLEEKLRLEELTALGGRLRVRLSLEPMDKETVLALLDHRLEAAGGTALLTPGLKTTLVERPAREPARPAGMGQELLLHAAERELKRLDEKLFLEIFSGDDRGPRKMKRS